MADQHSTLSDEETDVGLLNIYTWQRLQTFRKLSGGKIIDILTKVKVISATTRCSECGLQILIKNKDNIEKALYECTHADSVPLAKDKFQKGVLDDTPFRNYTSTLVLKDVLELTWNFFSYESTLPDAIEKYKEMNKRDVTKWYKFLRTFCFDFLIQRYARKNCYPLYPYLFGTGETGSVLIHDCPVGAKNLPENKFQKGWFYGGIDLDAKYIPPFIDYYSDNNNADENLIRVIRQNVCTGTEVDFIPYDRNKYDCEMLLPCYRILDRLNITINFLWMNLIATEKIYTLNQLHVIFAKKVLNKTDNSEELAGLLASALYIASTPINKRIEYFMKEVHRYNQ